MSTLARRVPMVGWVQRYDRGDLRADAVAGLTVAALVIPKNLGYAGIAHLPVEYGLYAVAAGALLYALFGTSRQIATGPSSSLATVAAGAVLATGVAAGDETNELVAAITIATGLLFLALGILRMGWISQFLSRAVVTGFLFGAAIQVVVGELGKLTGSSSDGENTFAELNDWLRGLDQRDTATIFVSAIGIGTVFALRRFAPKAPSALVLLVGGLVGSAVFDLDGRGVATVGDVPRGLPSLVVPDGALVRDHFAAIVAAAVAIVLIGYSQTAGDARIFAARHRYRVDVDQESIAQSAANLGAGFFQGMPVSTSLSASSLNDTSGARTQMASVVTGIAVLATLLFIAPLFSHLPTPILAVVIIDAVVFGMMDVHEMKRMWNVKRTDFCIAVAALVAVLAAGVLSGVLIGIGLSILWLVYVSTHPSTVELGRRAGSSAYEPLDVAPDGLTLPGVLVLRFSAGLFFATADALQDRLRQAALATDCEPLRVVVIDFGGVNFIDSQGAATFNQIVVTGGESAIDVRVARVQHDVLAVLEAEGVIAVIGADHVHPNLDDAVTAATA
jgi:sulfate permease, SulP family